MRRRYVQIDGALVEVGQEYRNVRHANSAHNIIPDIEPYTSMVDGRVITSRSKHREHLRVHGLVEVGNDSSLRNVEYRPPAPPPGLKETLIRVVNEKVRS